MTDKTDWTFNRTWPFKPRWHMSADGRLHYVDEGPRDGEPVIMLHGNPTWGYLYRNFIPALVKSGHRVIVPDYLGFGRSDKPDCPELYRISAHADRLGELLKSLDAHGATLVVHDWGGPIGMLWAKRHPERVKRLVVLNTYFHRPRERIKLPLPLRLFRTPLAGEVLVKGLHLFVRGAVFRGGVTHPERLTRDNKAAYLAPHPTWSSRTAILEFPRQIPSGPEGPVADLMGEVEAGLETFRNRPVQIFWAMKDIAFKLEVLRMIQDAFPDAGVQRLDDAGHYLQEDAYERIVPALIEFLED